MHAHARFQACGCTISIIDSILEGEVKLKSGQPRPVWATRSTSTFTITIFSLTNRPTVGAWSAVNGLLLRPTAQSHQNGHGTSSGISVTRTPMQQPPTCFLCFSSNAALAPLLREEVWLLTFPMCHKGCTWEADSTGVNVHFCIYVWVWEELDTKVLLSVWQMTDMHFSVGNFQKGSCSLALTWGARTLLDRPWKYSSVGGYSTFIIVLKSIHMDMVCFCMQWLCLCRALVFTCQTHLKAGGAVCLCCFWTPHTHQHCIQPNPYQTAHSASAIDLCLQKVQGFGISEAQGWQRTSPESYHNHLHLFEALQLPPIRRPAFSSTPNHNILEWS